MEFGPGRPKVVGLGATGQGDMRPRVSFSSAIYVTLRYFFTLGLHIFCKCSVGFDDLSGLAGPDRL